MMRLITSILGFNMVTSTLPPSFTTISEAANQFYATIHPDGPSVSLLEELNAGGGRTVAMSKASDSFFLDAQLAEIRCWRVST